MLLVRCWCIKCSVSLYSGWAGVCILSDSELSLPWLSADLGLHRD